MLQLALTNGIVMAEKAGVQRGEVIHLKSQSIHPLRRATVKTTHLPSRPLPNPCTRRQNGMCMCLGPGIPKTWTQTQAPSRTSCVSFHTLLDYSDPRNDAPPRTGGRIEG